MARKSITVLVLAGVLVTGTWLIAAGSGSPPVTVELTQSGSGLVTHFVDFDPDVPGDIDAAGLVRVFGSR